MREPLDDVWLRDGSLAVVSTHRNRFRFGSVTYPPFVDQRTGAPASGTVGVMVASQLAVDAQAIGTAMVVLGNREGQLRLGGVLPSPSVLWLLGDGSGEPLIATYRWSELQSR
jgi:thiamine biosynthesis lipoprotein ApbE